MSNLNIKKLILDNMKFSDNIAKKYLRHAAFKGMSLAELKSSAYLALCECAQKFDQAKGVKFSTFAYPHIKGQILRDIHSIQPFEVLEDYTVEDVDDDIDLESMWDIVNLGIDTILTQRERKVIRWAYGIDSEPMTFTEIARKMHLSKENIMRLHKSAFDKLKKYSKNYKFNNI